MSTILTIYLATLCNCFTGDRNTLSVANQEILVFVSVSSAICRQLQFYSFILGGVPTVRDSDTVFREKRDKSFTKEERESWSRYASSFHHPTEQTVCETVILS